MGAAQHKAAALGERAHAAAELATGQKLAAVAASAAALAGGGTAVEQLADQTTQRPPAAAEPQRQEPVKDESRFQISVRLPVRPALAWTASAGQVLEHVAPDAIDERLRSRDARPDRQPEPRLEAGLVLDRREVDPRRAVERHYSTALPAPYSW